ncbi:MAG: pirin family protein [Pseudomonadota bacterium]
MLKLRSEIDRGKANLGWLDSRHSFSFGHYHDPDHMGFRKLRVINEDKVVPGGGFAEHGHADMEIISYVLDGALAHQDSLGTGSTIRPGDVQRMSAGTGIRHSEFNASKDKPVHFLQIWLEPDQRGIDPSYEQKTFGDDRRGGLKLVASPTGRDGSLTLHQDVDLYASILEPGDMVSHSFASGRHGWIQVARGGIEIDGQTLQPGDGLAISERSEISITALIDAEFLLFDLA